ncbi:MAG: hypothetical protein NTU73_13240 [Ignavibacteriae bacterium]|nr:hypothetical protein [Ignavibacteriota bacterium]
MSLEKKSLEKKHKSLIDRNFKSLVDVFITFVKLKKEFPDIEFEGKDNIKLSSDGFIDFVNINDQEMRKIKNEYIQLCQLPSDTDEFRSKKIN